ncbi:MAG: hypothetical protein FWF75_08550, partial [Propionibacteriaceae bacterium]|nr:hypothetical protein [Propionibacteriaceae bacterium]
VERNAGILPRADGSIWFTGLPICGDHRHMRSVAGVAYELVADADRVQVRAGGEPWLGFPAGWRVVVRDGQVSAVVGMRAPTVCGSLDVRGHGVPWSVSLDLPPNHVARIAERRCTGVASLSFVAPHGD